MPEPMGPTILSDFLGTKGALKYGARAYKAARVFNSKYNKMIGKTILRGIGKVLSKKKKKSYGKVKAGQAGPTKGYESGYKKDKK
jgi:hypothetical protein